VSDGRRPGGEHRAVATIRRAIALADSERPGRGENYVALGSDFDGWVSTGFDASGWPLLTEGLLRAGVPEATIMRIMGGNVCCLLLRGLPHDGPARRPDLCRAG
jgi:microsomal dipeptidase-like Zn-dependent dipeptidase